MKLIERNRCVFTGRQDLELLYSFKKFPVFMGCVEHESDGDLVADMNWWISRSTGSVQLNPLIPPEILYQASHGSGSKGSLWMKHHQQFAEFINQLNCKSILEIGGGHGALAQCYQKLCSDSLWTIVEPNPTILETEKLHVIRKIFDQSFETIKQYDAVVHSHVFEHIYNPFEFLKQLRGLIKNDGHLIFSVPNQESQFSKNITYVLGFEHTIFFTDDLIEYLLKMNGYNVLNKKYFSNDHSIFYICGKQKGEDLFVAEPPKHYEFYKNKFINYIKYHIDMVHRMNERIEKSTLPVYLFGGHVSSQYLLAYGLCSKRILCILDNDEKKHKKRLYGSPFIIKSPEILRDLGHVIVILRQGVFNDEIKQDILANINSNVEFLE